MLTNGRKWGQEKITGLWIKEPLNTHPGFTALVSEWELPTEALKLLFWARTAWAGQALAAYTFASFLMLNLLVRSGLGLAHQFRLLQVTCLIVLDIRSFSFGDQGYVTFGGRGRASPNRLGPACFYLVLFLKDKISEQAWFDSTRQRMSSERRVGKKKSQASKGCLSRAQASGCGLGFLLCFGICIYQYPTLSCPLLGVGGGRECKLSNHQDI